MEQQHRHTSPTFLALQIPTQPRTSHYGVKPASTIHFGAFSEIGITTRAIKHEEPRILHRTGVNILLHMGSLLQQHQRLGMGARMAKNDEASIGNCARRAEPPFHAIPLREEIHGSRFPLLRFLVWILFFLGLSLQSTAPAFNTLPRSDRPAACRQQRRTPGKRTKNKEINPKEKRKKQGKIAKPQLLHKLGFFFGILEFLGFFLGLTLGESKDGGLVVGGNIWIGVSCSKLMTRGVACFFGRHQASRGSPAIWSCLPYYITSHSGTRRKKNLFAIIGNHGSELS
ncbi:hypothetical protein F5B21DRAFT_306915 [Xylaria acuta]|nr:hypothetical protein F5B21DRAFT_306915 [Xylaria acuta]